MQYRANAHCWCSLLISGIASQMSAAIPILSGLRRPSNTKNAAGYRSASKETVAITAALRLRDVMTLPFVVFFIGVVFLSV
jgi:hypothetical protein